MAHQIRGDINLFRELQLDGDPGTVGQVPVSQGPGVPAKYVNADTLETITSLTDNGDSTYTYLSESSASTTVKTHEEWEATDGSGTKVTDLTTALRRTGNVGTSNVFTDSAGSEPWPFPTVAFTPALRVLGGKSVGADWKQYWTWMVASWAFVLGDTTVEANAANTTALAMFPVPDVIFPWEVSVSARIGPVGGTAVYRIYRDTNAVPGSGALYGTITMPAVSPTGNVLDLRSNVGAAGEFLSTVVSPAPGNYFTMVVDGASTCTTFPIGLVLNVLGGLARIGN